MARHRGRSGGAAVSLERLREHRALWAAKPVLADVYDVWFREIASVASPGARVLEVGAGPGLLAEWARRHRPDLRWVAADLLPASWNDLGADASALPLRSGAMDLVAGIDVLHHLGRPRDFFTEAARVTGPGGRIALVEPWVTPLSYPIYRFAHEEGCTLRIDPWKPFPAEAKDAFEGDGALSWRIVRTTPEHEWRRLGFHAPRVVTANGFAYLLTLGFRRASLLPRRWAGPMIRLDHALRGLSRWTGMRALVVWERREG
jgi:SAM-dependent methyltransferase